MNKAKFRNECKHYVTQRDIIGLRERMKVIAERDEHSGQDGKYLIKSLYFDNCYDKALSEKLMGFEPREKFRIRYYNSDTNFIKLEKKNKIAGKCLKQSCVVTREQVERLLCGDTQWMCESAEGLLHELEAKMQYQLLRPKNIVAYEREAYVYSPGNVRVTIDSNICGSDNVSCFLRGGEVYTKLFNMSILEVKWDEYLPQVVRDAVQLENVKTRSFSKYAAVRFSAY